MPRTASQHAGSTGLTGRISTLPRLNFLFPSIAALQRRTTTTTKWNIDSVDPSGMGWPACVPTVATSSFTSKRRARPDSAAACSPLSSCQRACPSTVLHRLSKKQDIKLLAITSPTIIRFSIFFSLADSLVNLQQIHV